MSPNLIPKVARTIAALNATKCAAVSVPILSLFIQSLMIACHPGVAFAKEHVVADAIDYETQIQPIFKRYCVSCHGESGGESDVSLASLKSIQSGYPKGALIVPGDPGSSKILQLMLGQEPKMPPEDELEPTAEEIELVRKWIEQGAAGESKKSPLMKQEVAPKLGQSGQATPLFSIIAVDRSLHLVGLQGGVALKELGKDLEPANVASAAGKVTQIRPTTDKQRFVVSAGIPGVGGQVQLLRIVDKSLKIEKRLEAHSDVVNSAVLSPDARILATAGHDKLIHLWSVESGDLIRTLKGHNGAVYDLAFHPNGSILASASADETIKVWDVSTGDRLDTFGQGEGEQYAVRFSRDGQRVIAAGADKRIRCWQLPKQFSTEVSTMTHSVFAHEGAVLSLEISDDGQYMVTVGEDRSVKLWSSEDLRAIGVLGKIPDDATGVVWSDAQTVTVSSMDGLTYDFLIDSIVSAERSESVNKGMSIADPSKKTMPSDSDTSALQPLEVKEESVPRSSRSTQRITTNSIVSGVLQTQDMVSDEPGDWYSFDAKQGDEWIISVEAASKGSKLDSLVDVLDHSGQPVLRTRLQAVRESYFTFRGKDSTIADDFRLHRWEDMELNEYLYASGEVVKLWMYPRGPDSGFRVYPGRGHRVTYFDTTASTHALNEPAWIVSELQKDQNPIPNGQPVFPIYYSNDDASHRKSGTDSQIRFVAPDTGTYVIRLRDSRGQSGDDYHYRLSVLSPRPRFKVQVEQKEVVIRPGVGSEFSVVAERWDGLDGTIRFEISGLPEGVLVTEDFNVQGDQILARGALFLRDEDKDKIPGEFTVRFTPSSQATDGRIVHGDPVELKVKKGESTKLKLKVVQIGQGYEAESLSEVVIKAGTTTRVQLAIDRGGVNGDLPFGNEESGRNLPHGVFVDNIGLNGLLIPASENTREVFITAAEWVPEQVRYFHLRAESSENPTTSPIRIRVIR